MTADTNGAGVRERLRRALGQTTERLARAGIVSASAEARTLLQAAAEVTGPLVLVDALPARFDAHLEELVARRELREPLQLILGTAPFRRLDIPVRAGVFIPRPETELAIDLLLAHAREHPVATVVDLCTGSGALAAAVLDELPGCDVVACEIDPVALELASSTLESLRAARPRAGRVQVHRVDVTQADSLADLRGIDAVLSNPPYIPAGAVPRDAEVVAHDPARALYGGGADGLQVPRAVIARAQEMLAPGGLLIMEHADVQGAATRELAATTGGFTGIRTVPDLTGRDRFLVALREDAAAASAPSGQSGTPGNQ